MAETGAGDGAGGGFYRAALRPGERELWERAGVGSLDDELRLMRVQLFRLVRQAGGLSACEGAACEAGACEAAACEAGACESTDCESGETEFSGDKQGDKKPSGDKKPAGEKKASGDKKPAGEKKESKAAAPRGGESILKALDAICKLELARARLALAERKLAQDEPEADAWEGLEVVEYDG